MKSEPNNSTDRQSEHSNYTLNIEQNHRLMEIPKYFLCVWSKLTIWLIRRESLSDTLPT